MRIERNYHEQETGLIRKIEEEAAREKSGWQEAEESIQTEKTLKEAEQIIEAGRRLEEAARHIPNPKKAQRFQTLYEGMLRFAEIMAADIIIETDLEHEGTITLQTEHLIFDGPWRNSQMQQYLDLLSAADTVVYSVQKGLIRLECRFCLSDSVSLL